MDFRLIQREADSVVTEHRVERYLITNVTIVFVALLINQITQTVGAAALTHLVPNPTIYGEINVLLQILGLVGIFLSLGFNAALTYVMASGQAHSEDAFWIASLVGVGFGMLLAAVLSLFAGTVAGFYQVPALAAALWTASLILIVNSAVNVVMSVLSGHKFFRLQSLSMVLPVLSATLGMVIAIWAALPNGSLLRAAAFGQLAGAVVGLGLVVALAKPYLPAFRRTIDWTQWRPLFRYGFPMWAGNIAKSFQQPFLVIMMGLVSMSAAGYLSNGLKIGGFLNNITWAFNVVVLPWLSEVQGDARLVGMRATLAFRYNNYVIFPLTGLVILNRHFLTVAVFGPRYNHSAAYVLPVAVAIVFSSVSRLGGTLLAGIGRPRGNFWPMLVAGGATLIGVPLMLSHAVPLAAVYPYALGWLLATVLTIVFAVRDGLSLDYFDAFARPAMPLAMMLCVYWAGTLIGLPAGVVGVATAITLIPATWAIERWLPNFSHKEQLSPQGRV